MHTAGGEIVLIVLCSLLIGMGLYTASLCIATIWLISAIDFSDIASSMKVVAEKFLLTCFLCCWLRLNLWAGFILISSAAFEFIKWVLLIVCRDV